ncbi:uncharacterized protein C8A04DRAFT_11444 [Dichotomopilus funicola]|uniref:Amidase domain-containing protein n=1 Tax=Dichotomopilus funicola TaxID=1934379 RepID=A0AAN6ZNW6_9PEZI|nr:hypothetical protein C8A04DRAFT_11444 [Dichotomopilus funicola]
MAKSVQDLAAAMEILLNLEAREKLPAKGYQAFCGTSFEGLRLGFLGPSLWRFPPDLWVPSLEAKEQHDTVYHESRNRMQALGATVVYPVKLPQPSELNNGGDYTQYIVNCTFEHEETANEFFDEYVEQGSQVQSLASIVEFNTKHAAECLPKDAPDQSWLVKAVEDRPSDEQYRDAFEHMSTIGRDQGLRKTLDEHNLDLVIAPMDSPVCSLSFASGYPLANIPLGRYRLKGELSRPFGLAALARPGAERTLFRFMSAYKANFPPRVIPEQLLRASDI